MARNTDPLLTLPDKCGVLYVRLYQRMRALILDGSWRPGMRLPSSRRLAADLGISRNTASLALDQLLADGWIEARSRAGVFVSAELPAAGRGATRNVDRMPLRTSNPPIPFELAHGAIDAFPIDRWSRLQAKVWTRAVPDLLYEADMAGDIGLRQAIADLVAPTRGLTVAANDVMVVTSTQAALDLIAATLPPASAVVVEDPGYIFADAAFTSRGHRIVPAPVDRDGLDVAAARRAEPKPALIVTTPCFQFPTGQPMNAERRAALLNWANEAGAWVVDDEFDANFRFDGQQPNLPLRCEGASGQVITIGSFNRLLFNSLRMGFMIVPPPLREPLLRARQAVDQFVNLPNQLVLSAFIEEGGYAAHLRNCRDLYHARRDALLSLLKPYCGTVIESDFNPCGLHLVLRPLHITAQQLAARLRDSGVACMTIGDFVRHWPSEDGVLLGFAAFSEDVIEAMRPALDQALAPLLNRAALQRAIRR